MTTILSIPSEPEITVTLTHNDMTAEKLPAWLDVVQSTQLALQRNYEPPSLPVEPQEHHSRQDQFPISQ